MDERERRTYAIGVHAATLVTIPFSHYCEKARWALDRSQLPFVEQGHVPGFHRIAVKRTGSPRTSVPVLVTADRVFCDSTDILGYVDAIAPPEKKLYPANDGARDDVRALEAEYNERLGPHIRRVMYFHVLPRRMLAFGLMDQRTPAWERALLRVIFPLLRAGMRRFMRIDARNAATSRDEVLRVFDAIERRLEDGRPYLTGEHFTAADLTLAALAGPGIMPREHTIRFPRGEAAAPREAPWALAGAFVRQGRHAWQGSACGSDASAIRCEWLACTGTEAPDRCESPLHSDETHVAV